MIKFQLNFWSHQNFLPIGISFFSLQALSYFFDVKKSKISNKGFFDLLLYLSFFPQLLAGPIEKAKTLIPNFERLKAPSLKRIKYSTFIILIAIFKKEFLAERAYDAISIFHTDPISLIDYLSSTLFFSFYIYLDFSAYCQIARASALLFGIKIQQNFKRPYLAKNLKDFWLRWHISLRNFFVEYLYIPLGGKKYLKNTFIVFIVSSLWHGVSISFLLWGVSHFIFHTLQKLNKIKSNLFYTQIVVLLTWFFFQNPNWKNLYLSLQNSLNFQFNGQQTFILPFIILYFIWEYYEEKNPLIIKKVYSYYFQIFLLFFILFFGKFQSTGFLYYNY